MFFYRLALDPFSRQDEAHGIRFDSGSYRQQRILYPLIAGTLGGWSPSAVAYTLILTNWIAILAIAWIGVRLAQSAGLDGRWGIVFPLWPGLLLSLLRNLAEPTAIALMLAGALQLRRRLPAAAAATLTVAALARETTLLVPLAWFAIQVWQRVTKKDACTSWKPALLAAIPLAAYGVWTLILTIQWGVHPAVAGRGNLGWPLAAFLQLGAMHAPPRNFVSALTLGEQILLLGFAATVASSLRGSTPRCHERLAWILALILAFVGTETIWREDWAFLRALSEFYMLGALILIGSPRRRKAPLFSAFAALWGVLLVYGTQLLEVLLRGSVPPFR
jgi:hypothetical protein